MKLRRRLGIISIGSLILLLGVMAAWTGSKESEKVSGAKTLASLENILSKKFKYLPKDVKPFQIASSSFEHKPNADAIGIDYGDFHLALPRNAKSIRSPEAKKGVWPIRIIYKGDKPAKDLEENDYVPDDNAEPTPGSLQPFIINNAVSNLRHIADGSVDRIHFSRDPSKEYTSLYLIFNEGTCSFFFSGKPLEDDYLKTTPSDALIFSDILTEAGLKKNKADEIIQSAYNTYREMPDEQRFKDYLSYSDQRMTACNDPAALGLLIYQSLSRKSCFDCKGEECQQYTLGKYSFYLIPTIVQGSQKRPRWKGWIFHEKDYVTCIDLILDDKKADSAQAMKTLIGLMP